MVVLVLRFLPTKIKYQVRIKKKLLRLLEDIVRRPSLPDDCPTAFTDEMATTCNAADSNDAGISTVGCRKLWGEVKYGVYLSWVTATWWYGWYCADPICLCLLANVGVRWKCDGDDLVEIKAIEHVWDVLAGWVVLLKEISPKSVLRVLIETCRNGGTLASWWCVGGKVVSMAGTSATVVVETVVVVAVMMVVMAVAGVVVVAAVVGMPRVHSRINPDLWNKYPQVNVVLTTTDQWGRWQNTVRGAKQVKTDPRVPTASVFCKVDMETLGCFRVVAVVGPK
ncbi:hypothetical protein BD779DRAFT_1478262 [Infundibulicybe gibba]|nr:hypothetical protein BD779DRAFT_1478262 [Infundibulicybe gibba]